jgi:oligosaccharide repeat unit polymerase
MLFDSTGGDITLFIRRPWLLAYLGTSDFGVRSSFGFLWVYGTYMLPLAALIWLAITGSQGKSPGLTWWIFMVASIAALMLFSPRAIVVSFIVSALVVYHLTVSRIRLHILLMLGLFAVGFSYLINLWRSIARTVSLQGIVEGVGIIIGQANISIGEALRFVGGTDLSDIRTFTLISYTYGNALPLKYGATLLRILYQVIPRAIWPDKPLGLGYEIGLLFGSSYSGVPPGFFGEMYMNFHVFGVIIGGMILGYGLAALYREWIVKRDGVIGIVLYAILVPMILLLPSSTIANRITSMAILFIGTFLAFGISVRHRERIKS